MTMTVYYLLIHTTEHIYTHMGSMITPGPSLSIVLLYFSMEIKKIVGHIVKDFSTAINIVYLKHGALRKHWGIFLTRCRKS